MKRSFGSDRATAQARFLYKAIKASSILAFAFAFTPYSLLAAECSVSVGAPACSSKADPGSTRASFLPSPYVTNPVDVLTGNKYQRSDDYLGFGSRLQFSRHYNSADSDARTVLGAGWRHSYDVTLKRASPSRLLLKQSDGRILEFIANEQSNTTYHALHSADGFVEVADLNRWNLTDGRVLSFKGSFLVEVSFPDSRSLRLKYKNNRLDSVTDHFDRSIKLEYYSGEQTLGSYDETLNGRSAGDLQYLVLPDGSRVNYQYDNLQNLTSVGYPEGTQSIYEYKDSDFTHHLTGASEALESTQKFWKYDHYGRAIQHTNEAAEFVVDIEFAPISDQQTEQRTRVKTSDGWKADYGWQHSNEINLPIVTDYQEQACPTCKPTQKRITEQSIVDWKPPPAETKPAVQKKSAQQTSAPEKVEEPIQFVATDGSLGGMVTMRSAAGGGGAAEKYQVTVDRIGKVRDVSDGVDSLSEVKVKLQKSSVLNPRLQRSSFQGCSGLNCTQKAHKLFDVSKSARKSFSNHFINNPHNPTNEVVNNRFCAGPVHRNCDQLRHEYKLAQLSNCVYEESGNDDKCGNGYRKVRPKKFGLTPDLFESKGFKAALYRNRDGKMVLAFRGTRGGLVSVVDWKNNITQGKGNSSKYYEQAKVLVRALTRAGAVFEVTGHSLGGGLAGAAALDSPVRATVFNAASVHPNSVRDYWKKVEQADNYIVSYTVDGDLLSHLQDTASPDHAATKDKNDLERTTLAAVGQRIVLNPPGKAWLEPRLPTVSSPKDTEKILYKAKLGIELHSMDAILESLKTRVIAKCKSLI